MISAADISQIGEIEEQIFKTQKERQLIQQEIIKSGQKSQP